VAAATKANGRQDEQDLQDGFSPRPTGATPSFLLNPVTSFILFILFILSKIRVGISGLLVIEKFGVGARRFTIPKIPSFS
jgi:hypothetical protein